MATVNCPNCHHDVEIRIMGTAPRTKKSATGSISSAQLKAVLGFMRRLGAGRKTTTYLYSLYLGQQETFHLPNLTPNTLGRALRLNGATPWRTADERGWDIPVIPDEQKAAKPAEYVQEREARADFEAAVVAHAAEPPAAQYRSVEGYESEELPKPLGPSFRYDLPFAVEGYPDL